LEEPGRDAEKGVSGDRAADETPGPQHVVVRRASHVFGETPIGMPAPAAPERTDGPPEEAAALEPRVRHAAIAAALKAGGLACVAGVFMGLVLFCFLGGLLPGSGSLMIGLVVAVTAVPVSIIAAFSSYRQTLESERHKVGLCPQCGYDLRGSVGARCPECGWRIRTPGRSQAPWTEEDEAREHIN
jgi:hypothetical protein